MSKSQDEREADAIASMWAVVEKCTSEIARARRSAELMHNISNEQFDARLNEMCEAAYKKFSSVDRAEMALDVLMELFAKHDVNELAEKFR